MTTIAHGRISTAQPFLPKRAHAAAAMSHLHLLLFSFIFILHTSSAVLYNDGQTHSIQTALNDAITLRSSSSLTLPPGDYAIRSPSGSDGAIQLYMSSSLNATGGDVMGADADATNDHPEAGAGVIVGGASHAVFYDGVTVRGGNHLGADATVDDQYYYSVDSSLRNDEAILLSSMFDSNSNNINGGGGQGGDALISQYIGSNVTIYGGSFIAGRGSTKDGHSLHAKYEAQIHVLGGSFYGSWMASDQGSIVVNGCVSRIGTRLVGRLENGHSLDVQVFEEGEGKIVVNKCNQYRKPKSSAVSVMGSVHYLLLGMFLLALGLAAV
ncbi:hypothetical protein ACHAXR_007942 [Thalassiosira sp. AJA248-18]